MGEYNCGDPYRPYTFKGEKGYKGPFTKDVEFLTCSELPSGCPGADKFIQRAAEARRPPATQTTLPPARSEVLAPARRANRDARCGAPVRV